MKPVHTVDRPAVYSLTRPLQHVRASDLVSKRATLDVFAAQPSARVITGSLIVVATARSLTGPFGVADLVVPAVSLALVGVVEWVVHRHVLHAPASRMFGLGAGHRRHHEQPAELRWLMLSGLEALGAVLALGAFSAAWAAPLAIAVSAPVAGTVLTAWVCATLGLLHYEWVHLLVHTRYRPRTAYYARLARLHRAHHHRDEHAWLGITSHLGDRLLRTAPQAAAPPAPHRLGNG